MSESANQSGEGSISLEVPAADHHVTIEYAQHFEDELKISENDVIEVRDRDGVFGQDDLIYCKCGATFLTKKEARVHLETVLKQHRGLPLPNLPDPVEWEDSEPEPAEIATAIKSSSRAMGKPLNNEGYFEATAREQLTPPEAYGFEGWEELQEGGTLYSEEFGGRLFREPLLKKGLAWVTGRKMLYDPEEYTIYFQGWSPLYVKGPKRAILLAPVER